MTASPDVTPADRRLTLISTLVPILVIAAAAGVGAARVLAVRDRLPDPVATHWGADGAADGFSSVTAALTTGVLLTVLISLFLVVLARVVCERIWLPATASGLAVMLASVSLGSVSRQAGLPDARAATIGPALVLGAVAGLASFALVAAGLWALDRRVPRPVTRAPLPEGKPSLAPSLSATWQGPARTGRVGRWMTLMPAIVLLVAGLWAAWQGIWWLMAVFVLVAAALVAALRCQVVISRDGVVIECARIRVARVRLDQIEYAETTRVHALEYGGMGLRIAVDGTRALITDRGEALCLVRVNAPRFVMTVDDADTAAATVNALIAATRG